MKNTVQLRNHDGNRHSSLKPSSKRSQYAATGTASHCRGTQLPVARWHNLTVTSGNQAPWQPGSFSHWQVLRVAQVALLAVLAPGASELASDLEEEGSTLGYCQWSLSGSAPAPLALRLRLQPETRIENCSLGCCGGVM